MARRLRKDLTIFSLSFMDCICCGFGAIILLLTLNRGIVSKVIEQQSVEEESILERTEEEVFEVFGEVAMLELELIGVKEAVAAAEARLSALAQQRTRILGEFAAVPDLGVLVEQAREELAIALQERDKLRDAPPPWRVDSVGGIPADSRFVIFVLDTSGSIAERRDVVRYLMRDILELYPALDGVQIVNDEGFYLAGSSGRWIPGDAAGRKRVYDGAMDALNRTAGAMTGGIFSILGLGAPYNSTSDPANGLIRALTDFGGGDQISIYVLGDDGPDRRTTALIVDFFDRNNPRDSNGRRRVRVHGIGILTQHGDRDEFGTGMRFIANRYDGAFVGMTY